MVTIAQTGPTVKLPTGNRCGFVLTEPRFLAANHRHPFIARMQQEARRMFTERHSGKLYTGRQRIRTKDRQAFGQYHAKGPKGERAEAVALVLADMFGHTNLANLRIIDYGTDEGISLSRYATNCGISIDRVKGAIADLRSCGHLGGYQKREIKRGKYCGLVATRWLTRELLKALGLWRAYVAMKKGDQPKQPSEIDTSSSGPAHRLVNDLASKLAVRTPEQNALQARISALEWIIGQDNPTWTVAEVAAEARRRLPK